MLRPAAAFHWPLRRGASRLLVRGTVVLLSTRSRRFDPFGLALFTVVIAFAAAIPRADAITIKFDYSQSQTLTQDTLNFFGTDANPSPARAALDFAARTFTPFTDTLSAIQPSGVNSWTARFLDPSTGLSQGVSNLSVPQDTIVVYVIARDLLGGALGQASVGTQSIGSNATSSFYSAVTTRGQGDASTDFAAWGGVLAIDVQNSAGVPRNWHYDHSAPPALDEYDFYTMVTHELAHLFGFGTANSFANDVLRESETTAYFTGELTQQLYGGSVPMYVPPNPAPNFTVQHWGPSVTSPPFLPGTQPKPSLGPSLPLGERKLFTPLDYAALADIGWQVPPELFGLPADFNGDAVVDGADFLIWQRGYGGFGGTPGDANGDLRVDDYDGWIVRNYLGSQGMVPEWLATNAAVPEPTAAALAVIAGALTFVSRYRRREVGKASRHNSMNDVTTISCNHAKPK
jgi:hypothetical protein